MWLTKIFTAVLAIATGLLPSSCTKVKSAKAQHAATAAATASLSTTNKNLGELALTNHYETCVDLGAGKSCTFKPTLLDHSNLQLTMAVESKNAAGKTEGLSIVQFVTKSGKPFEVAVGDMNFTLTPKLQNEQ
jgi:hypothetical protein